MAPPCWDGQTGSSITFIGPLSSLKRIARSHNVRQIIWILWIYSQILWRFGYFVERVGIWLFCRSGWISENHASFPSRELAQSKIYFWEWILGQSDTSSSFLMICYTSCRILSACTNKRCISYISTLSIVMSKVALVAGSFVFSPRDCENRLFACLQLCKRWFVGRKTQKERRKSYFIGFFSAL